MPPLPISPTLPAWLSMKGRRRSDVLNFPHKLYPCSDSKILGSNIFTYWFMFSLHLILPLRNTAREAEESSSLQFDMGVFSPLENKTLSVTKVSSLMAGLMGTLKSPFMFVCCSWWMFVLIFNIPTFILAAFWVCLFCFFFSTCLVETNVLNGNSLSNTLVPSSNK